jgi:ribosomal protein S18 acetylase RimI-like enzyme
MPVSVAPISPDQFDTMLQAFNQGYEGYIVPLHLEAEQLHGHIEGGSIDLSASRMAYSDGEAVGVALLGIREKRAWVGGIGVSPAWRGQGIGRLLMNALIDAARERGLDVVQLEVIQGNTSAHKLYLSLGFEDIRRLLILERKPTPSASSSSPLPMQWGGDLGEGIESVPPADALAHYASFHAIPNPWQRERDSLRRLEPRMTGWLAQGDGQTLAYTVGFAAENGIQFMDLGFAPGQAAALQALINHVHAQFPEANGRMVNLGEDDPAWPLLADFGYVETMAQYEMLLKL